MSDVVAAIALVISDSKARVSAGSTTTTTCQNGITMTLSFGAPVSSWRSVQESILAATQAGIFIVAAAGNDNIDVKGITPASSPFVCSVGASDINDVKAPFSNYGATIGVFAPGVGIQSAWIGGIDASVCSNFSSHLPNEGTVFEGLSITASCAGRLGIGDCKAYKSSPLRKQVIFAANLPILQIYKLITPHPILSHPIPYPSKEEENTNITSAPSQQSLSGTSMAAPHIAALGANIMTSKGPQNPLNLCTTIKNTANVNALSGLPGGTPNRLAYNGVA